MPDLKKGRKLNKVKRGVERVFSEDVQVAHSSSDSSDDEVPSDQVKKEVKNDDGFERVNANRSVVKNMKISDLKGTETVELSRREREEIEKKRKEAAFWKAQMEGKTDQAKSDLARLAVIKKQREEAARKKQEEMAEKATSSSKQESLNAGKAVISKSLGKKI